MAYYRDGRGKTRHPLLPDLHSSLCAAFSPLHEARGGRFSNENSAVTGLADGFRLKPAAAANTVSVVGNARLSAPLASLLKQFAADVQKVQIIDQIRSRPRQVIFSPSKLYVCIGCVQCPTVRHFDVQKCKLAFWLHVKQGDCEVNTNTVTGLI